MQVSFERYLHAIALGVLSSFRVPIPQKLKRDAKPRMSFRSRIIRLMNKQTKSPPKATILTKEETRRQECCGYCENCTTIGLRLARLGSIGFSKRKTVPGKPMQKVLGPIRRIRYTQSTLHPASIREKKGPSLGKNTSQKSSSAKSLRYEI